MKVDDCLALRPDAAPELLLQRLQAGNLCFAARHAGRVVSVTWVATGRAHLSTCELPLEDCEVLLFDSFTDPALRGRHVQTALLPALLEHYRAAGYRRAVVLIVPENRSSVRSRERSGFRRTATMHRFGTWSVLSGKRSP
jgi:GNAT superfamily N-acetyltransferase